MGVRSAVLALAVLWPATVAATPGAVAKTAAATQVAAAGATTTTTTSGSGYTLGTTQGARQFVAKLGSVKSWFTSTSGGSEVPVLDATTGTGFQGAEGYIGIRAEVRPISWVGINGTYGYGVAGHRTSVGVTGYGTLGRLRPFAWFGFGRNSVERFKTLGLSGGLAYWHQSGLHVAAELGYAWLLNPVKGRDGLSGPAVDRALDRFPNPGGVMVAFRAGYSIGHWW